MREECEGLLNEGEGVPNFKRDFDSQIMSRCLMICQPQMMMRMMAMS